MRFHIGFSKRISWKWIILIIGGIAAFFGIGNHAVLAATTGTYNWTPSYGGVVNSDISAAHGLTLVSRTGGVLGDNYYINFNTSSCSGGVACAPVYEGYVYFGYPKHDFCPDSDTVSLTFKYFTRTTTPPTIFPSNYFATNVRGWYLLNQNFNSSDNYYTTTFKVQDNVPIELQFGFDGSLNSNYFVSSAVSKSFTYNCDYSLEESTSDIMNNDNNNTQQIIDSQNNINNSINDDNVQSGVSHGGNLFTNTNINDHGVSTIVTAPVRLLQGMLNSGSSCNDLILFTSIFGQDKLVTMPSGCILWNRAPSSIVSIYHVVIFGLLGYYVLVDIWKTVTDVLDPERKNDYVMDL